MASPHPDCAKSRQLATLPLSHGFFGRTGGISQGVYDSLNAGFTCGDDPANVAENRARIANSLNIDPALLVSVKQVHGLDCAYVDGATDVEADAMVTDKPGIGLGIMTADCAPVLFATDKVIGAAHAGWGGALKGVLESTLEAMEKLGAKREDIRAAIGPCIGLASYEVSAGFETPFLKEDAESERFFRYGSKPDKRMFDLSGYCAYRLARAGVGRIDITGQDTCAMESTYFSHRRTTLAGGTKRGLQLSVISLNLS